MLALRTSPNLVKYCFSSTGKDKKEYLNVTKHQESMPGPAQGDSQYRGKETSESMPGPAQGDS